MFIYVLCEVATVSQLCISFPYVLHGLCEDYLTCDIAYNAVMPLSHASTRGRYNRIVGVTTATDSPLWCPERTPNQPSRDVLGLGGGSVS